MSLIVPDVSDILIRHRPMVTTDHLLVISCPGKQDGTRIAVITLLGYNTNCNLHWKSHTSGGCDIFKRAWRDVSVGVITKDGVILF